MVGCALQRGSVRESNVASTAIKTNIFRQLNWSIRRPTAKQSKQLHRETRQYAQKNRSMEADPREEKKEQILKHTGWSFKKSYTKEK